VRLYGLASRISRDVDEWRLTREDVEQVLADVLEDEPDLAATLYVFELELGPEAGASLN
jgi:hypothetical protein